MVAVHGRLCTIYLVTVTSLWTRPSRQMLGQYLKIISQRLPSKSSHSSLTYQPFIRRYIVWVTEKASLNKLQRDNALRRLTPWNILLLEKLAVQLVKNLWNPKFNGRVDSSPPLDPVLSKIIGSRAPIPYFLKIHLSVIFSLADVSSLYISQVKLCMHLNTHSCYVPNHLTLPLIWSP
jgi:hypothetical protein